MSLLTATRKLVAEIKSPDEFETLATAVLRAARPAYLALIHVGTNENGRTVRSPIDVSDCPNSCDKRSGLFSDLATAANLRLCS